MTATSSKSLLDFHQRVANKDQWVYWQSVNKEVAKMHQLIILLPSIFFNTYALYQSSCLLYVP